MRGEHDALCVTARRHDEAVQTAKLNKFKAEKFYSKRNYYT